MSTARQQASPLLAGVGEARDVLDGETFVEIPRELLTRFAPKE
ncbi:hypothetical protein [Streptomyces sp. NPDC029004]